MKIGFLGAGAMGGAIISGAIKEGIVDPQDIYISDFSKSITEKYRAMGCNIVSSNRELGEAVDILQVAVKPQYAESALKSPRSVVISGIDNTCIRFRNTSGNITFFFQDEDIQLILCKASEYQVTADCDELFGVRRVGCLPDLDGRILGPYRVG